jgi:UDP-2-acetamido-3-amino-2,3-dideoxy-glucuronate N-acetyltransferase
MHFRNTSHPSPRIEKMYIHPTAEVEDDVIIGAETRVWHLCHIRTGVRIGTECILGRGVYVDTGVEIGNRVKIQNYVSVFHGVTIEDGVFVGPHVCFTNDRFPRGINVDGSLKGTADWIVTPTRVRTGASIGANATIVCGTTLGRWAMVGAGSVVTKDVPDYVLVAGNPARMLGYVCPCGVRKESLEAAQNCNQCQTKYPD